MTQMGQVKAAKKFVENWTGHGYEKGESQKFWIDLLTSVFGVENISSFIFFEEQVKDKLFLTTLDERIITNFIDAYIPSTRVMIEQKSSSKDFLHNKKRYCLWLEGASPTEIKKCPLVYERVKKCKESRENSIAEGIRKFANTPHLFAQRTQPIGVDYIIVPRVSSENRRYVPIGFMSADTIVSDAVQIVPDATLYEFGVMTSNVHMAWMRAVCGRLKSDYRYSKDIVYNNFVWCNPTVEQKAKIEETAQGILDVRAKYPDSSLADLYDEILMPQDLRKAHHENDKAVMSAYGFNPKTGEQEIVSELFRLYEKLSGKTS